MRKRVLLSWAVVMISSAIAVYAGSGDPWNNGDTIPGYVLSAPYGSRADVVSKGAFAGGAWTLEIKRLLDTGHNDDHQFVVGTDEVFSLAITDNSGGNANGATVLNLDWGGAADATTIVPYNIAGNAGTPPAIDGDDSDAVWANADVSAVNLGTVMGAGSGVTSATVQCAYDADYIYWLVSWTDTAGTESITKAQWTYNAGSWTQSGNEDRVYFMFNINATDWSAGNGGCAAYCHEPPPQNDPIAFNHMRTNNAGDKAEMWHWKATRTNPIGFADDKVLLDDLADPSSEAAAGDKGAKTYTDNKGILPKYQADVDPGANATHLFFTPTGSRSAVPFDPNVAWQDGDTIPGYNLRAPYGSRADVVSKGKFVGGAWTLEMKRLLDTGNADDHQFVVGVDEIFALAVTDNAGGDANGAVALDLDWGGTADATTIVPYDIVGNAGAAPKIDGDGSDAVWGSADASTVAMGTVMGAGSGVTSATVKCAYDGEYIFWLVSWTDPTATESAAKKQWTYNAGTWTQSGNEDRVYFMFNINATDWSAGNGGCAAYCHQPPGQGDPIAFNHMRTNNPGEKTEMWHWKAARTNPIGFADDKVLVDDTADPNSEAAKGDKGKSAYSDNKDGAQPKWQAESDPGASAPFLFAFPTNSFPAVGVAAVDATPNALDFGNVQIGNSADLQVTVSNVAHSASLGLLGAASDNADFTVVAPATFPQVIASGDSVQVTVRFTPSAEGAANGNLTLTTNDVERPFVFIPLSGNGTLLPMTSFKILKAKIKPNKKGGYKANVQGTFQMASDKVLAEGVIFTIGFATYTEQVFPEEKKTTWKYKRPKGAPTGIKKLTIKWDKKTDPNRNAKKFTVATDTAEIFENPPTGLGQVDVFISLQQGLNKGEEVIGMTEKKGKLSYKAPK